MWLILLVFLASVLASYLINTSALTIIGHRIRRVVPVSIMTNIAGLSSLYIIGKVSDWNIPVIVAVGIGDVLADLLVCLKWPKPVYNWLVGTRKKRVAGKKIPKEITTA